MSARRTQQKPYDAPQRARRMPDPPRYKNEWADYEPERPARKRKRHPLAWATLLLLCVIVLVGVCWGAVSLYEQQAVFDAAKDYMTRDTFFNNIYVDNVSVGGLTRAQAESALAASAAGGQTVKLTITVSGYTFTLTEADVPITRNLSSVLDTAYAIGRQGSSVTLGTDTTPFSLRYQHALATQKSGAYLYTSVTYDMEDVRKAVSVVESYVNREPVDAMIATFDFSSRSFTFTDESYGLTLDAEGLAKLIAARLDARDYTAVIEGQADIVTPNATKAELMASFVKVSSFTTATTSNENRNTNINLAAQAITGSAVMPGETFSFNETTGQRTTQKGYLPAPAIAGGTTVDDIGGGVCQVSSTLFNAVAMANLEIVTRSPHAWPSSYVDKGRDATVDWPSLDFKFKNNKDTPVFIVAYYNSRKITVELYGMTLGVGESIDLETEVTSTTPPGETIYTQNPSLAPGTQNTLKKARTGYTVDTYRVYKNNGTTYRRELLFTSTYKMIREEIEYN